ncbi:MAG TPA: hypothetical protein VEM96_13020 [Pyrinomonadaceae bacterium]|nr:hypothetical protein [Pyrinomonadaceae bacterium]
MPKPTLLGITKEARIRVCHCPQCNETINAELDRCPHCAAPIDPTTALADADTLERIGHACSQSEYLRIAVTAPLMAVLVGIFLPGGFLLGPIFAVAVLFMIGRWWKRYGKIQTNDPDFKRARFYMVAVTVIGIFFLCLTLGLVAAFLLSDK